MGGDSDSYNTLDMRNTLLLSVTVFLAAFIYLCSGLVEPLNIQDEGNVLYSSVRLLSGEFPYRDFWTIYPPGQVLTISALFSVFGKSILVTRIWDCIVRALVVVMVLLIGRRLMSGKAALLAAVLSCCWLGSERIFSYNALPALFLLLLTIFVSSRSFFVAGLLAAVTLCFRLDFGTAAVTAMLTAVLTGEDRRRHLRVSAAGFAPFVLALAGLGYAFGGHRFLDEVVIFPLHGLSSARSIPVQWMKLPSLLLFAGIPLGAFAAWHQREARPLLIALIILVLCKLSRFDYPHIQSVLPLAFLMSICATEQFKSVLITVVFFLTALTVPLVEKFIPVDEFQKTDQVHAVDYLETVTGPGERIFSGAGRHDVIFGNDMSFYFLAERPAGTYYHELHPGITDSPAVQEEIRGELERNGADYIVLYDGFRSRLPQVEKKDSVLDTYFQNRFDEVWREGDYSIRKRR